MSASKRREHERAGVPRGVTRPKVPVALLVRMFVVGSVAVGAAAWAIHRHYFVPRPPMREPEPPATEIPAPELDPSR